MNDCLQNIVSVSNPCESVKVQSTSGYDLFDAPEINKSNISQIAGSDAPNGFQFLKQQLEFAIRDVNNDFIALLNTNNLIANLNVSSISTGVFNSGILNNKNQKRGITIHRNPKNYKPNSIKKLTAFDVLIYPVNDHSNVPLYIMENNEITTIPISLVGGKINKFPINYQSKYGSKIHIYLDDIDTYSSELTCLVGCNGTIPNECGYVKGYNNGSEIQREGFGINAVFGCECDYSALLCRYSQAFIGKIIYLKARANILQERIHNDRVTPFIIYGREQAEELYVQVENEYRASWNAFVESVPNLLINDTDCINCKKINIVVNV